MDLKLKTRDRFAISVLSLTFVAICSDQVYLTHHDFINPIRKFCSNQYVLIIKLIQTFLFLLPRVSVRYYSYQSVACSNGFFELITHVTESEQEPKFRIRFESNIKSTVRVRAGFFGSKKSSFRAFQFSSSFYLKPDWIETVAALIKIAWHERNRDIWIRIIKWCTYVQLLEDVHFSKAIKKSYRVSLKRKGKYSIFTQTIFFFLFARILPNDHVGPKGTVFLSHA